MCLAFPNRGVEIQYSLTDRGHGCQFDGINCRAWGLLSPIATTLDGCIAAVRQ